MRYATRERGKEREKEREREREEGGFFPEEAIYGKIARRGVKNFERHATSGWVQQVIAGDVWLFPSLVVVVVVVIVPPPSPRDSLSVLLCSRDDASRRARTRIQCVRPQRVSRQSRNPRQRIT